MPAYNAQFTNTNEQFQAANKVSDVAMFEALMEKQFGSEFASQGDLFNAFNTAYTASPKVLADYIQNAKPLISKQVVAYEVMEDPLNEFFNIGDNPMQGSLQVITQDIAKPMQFMNAGENPYTTMFNDSYAQHFVYKLDLISHRTVQHTQIEPYFTDPTTLNNYIAGIAVSLINGHRITQFYREKLMFSIAMELGLTPYDVGGTIPDLLLKIQNTADGFTYANTNNAQGRMTATTIEDVAVILPFTVSNAAEITTLSYMFNPEYVTRRRFTRIVIDGFPDVYRTLTDHVVTVDDVQKGYVEIATQANNLAGIQIGSKIPAGSLVPASAPFATKTFDGTTLQAWIGAKHAVMFSDDVPLRTNSYVNPYTDALQMRARSKRTYAYVTAFNSVGIYSVAPTEAAASRTIVNSTEIPTISKVGVPLTVEPATFGPNADNPALNVRGRTHTDPTA